MVVKAGLSTFFFLLKNLHLRKISISIYERFLDLADVAVENLLFWCMFMAKMAGM